MVDHRELNDPDFLTIPGMELHVEGWDGNILKTLHMNALAKDPDHMRFVAPPAEYSIPCIQEKINELRGPLMDFFRYYNIILSKRKT